jgi:hypothetical protein
MVPEVMLASQGQIIRTSTEYDRKQQLSKIFRIIVVDPMDCHVTSNT